MEMIDIIVESIVYDGSTFDHVDDLSLYTRRPQTT